MQRLQFFLSESRWDPEQVNARRLELLRADPATAPHGGGVLVIDDSGDRKDGTKTAHVGHQWLGRYGKTDNGVVTVTTVWADERLYYPVHAVPYTPARHFAKGKSDPGFRTKLAIGADLAVRARAAGFTFRAVPPTAPTGTRTGSAANSPRPGCRSSWHSSHAAAPGPTAADAHTPVDAARALAWGGPDDPGDWQPVTRTFRDGHAETWWAADATLGWWGPDGVTAPGGGHRRPGHPAGQGHLVPGHEPAPPRRPARGGQPAPGRRLAEIVRIYGIRNWIEQGYKQVKDELGWADFQVRSDTAIRRHQVLVNCAFSFCWDAWFTDPPPHPPRRRRQIPAAERGGPGRRPRAAAVLAPGAPRRARLARPVDRAAALVDRLVEGAPAPQLQALMTSLAAGHGLHLYIPN